ncbi:monovalent cation/H(+) antiporter subunit G [Spongiactinospora sp. TRM90649]|uniref:monovalent cation/H(+) antiporter subunit G n=1 Tax=Spongiactinospora sp. TRM90649 TaxID=3031114 RepID=UPI0023F64E94|nr:monovalent cation/H(+) antiporter subunit G [Spongiactinospora sp. TRM90649]MDF5756025.1 monovalent cation/H(+) antiporter subunit G [Spongiactinospora sp. TRM90649]
MTVLNGIMDVLAALFLLIGAIFSLTAGIGLLRFPDLLSRLHTGAKPQVIGLIATLVAIGLSTRTPSDIGILVLVAIFQLMTAPVAAHIVGRAGYRSGRIREDLLVVDELSRDLSNPG